MILTTGGRASGATSTRSRPRSCAAARASSIDSTPNWSPLSAITRTGLMRICRLTRVRGALLLLSGRGRCFAPGDGVKNADPGCPKIRNSSPSGEVSKNPGALSSGEAAGGAPFAPAYRIVDGKLAERHSLHKPDALSFFAEPPAHDARIVLENHQPALALGPLSDPLFARRTAPWGRQARPPSCFRRRRRSAGAC